MMQVGSLVRLREDMYPDMSERLWVVYEIYGLIVHVTCLSSGKRDWFAYTAFETPEEPNDEEA